MEGCVEVKMRRRYHMAVRIDKNGIGFFSDLHSGSWIYFIKWLTKREPIVFSCQTRCNIFQYQNSLHKPEKSHPIHDNISTDIQSKPCPSYLNSSPTPPPPSFCTLYRPLRITSSRPLCITSPRPVCIIWLLCVIWLLPTPEVHLSICMNFGIPHR